jgi:hypothetical protein
MKTLICFILLTFLVTPGFSQGVIQGNIHDSQAKGISYANILLRTELDSAMIKGAISDESGNYVFTDIPKGDYFVEVTILGYAKSYSPVFVFLGTEKSDLAAIQLHEEDQNLDEVTVTATRPLFELEQGKMVVNVANSISAAGLSVLDVLERSPGVSVNRQSNSLSVLGKNGVVILMNGQRFRMPLEAAYQMLSGLNSSDVEKIEIITVPPANYDADGDAGFINIVMKKDNSLKGTNGSLTVGQGYGTGYNGNMSFNLNHQGPKFSWFSLLSSTYVAREGIIDAFRGNSDGFEYIGIKTDTEWVPIKRSVNYQAGFDYKLGQKSILSGLLSGHETRNGRSGIINTESNYSISPDTLVMMTINEDNNWSHIMGNINLQHTFHNGQVISSNVDYLTYKNSNPSQYTLIPT